jgi:hypothetical protein
MFQNGWNYEAKQSANRKVDCAVPNVIVSPSASSCSVPLPRRVPLTNVPNDETSVTVMLPRPGSRCKGRLELIFMDKNNFRTTARVGVTVKVAWRREIVGSFSERRDPYSSSAVDAWELGRK